MLGRHYVHQDGSGSRGPSPSVRPSSSCLRTPPASYASCSSSSQEDIYHLDPRKRDKDEEDVEDEEEDEEDDDDAPTPVNEGMAANADFQWLRQPSQGGHRTSPTFQHDPSATLVRPKYRRTASPQHHSHQQLVPWHYDPCYAYHQGGYHHHHHMMTPPPPSMCCCSYEDYGSNYCCGRVGDCGDRPRRHSHHGTMDHGYYLPSASPSYGTFPTGRKVGCSPSPSRTPNTRQHAAGCREASSCYDARHPTLLLPTINACEKQGNVMGGDPDDWQEKMHQLQVEKENLLLQVSVLSEQVEAQAEKLRELESALEDRKDQLDGTEEMLQQEMVSRSQLENSKLDLLGQVLDLKRKLAVQDQDRMEQNDRCKKLEAEVIITKGRLVEREAELTTLRARLARNGTITPILGDQYSEIDKLRQALDTVIATKEEREKKIEELTLQVSRQKRVQDWLPQDRRASDPSSPEMNLQTLYSPSGDSNKSESRLLEKPPPVPRFTSTPVSHSGGTSPQGNDPRYTPSPSLSLHTALKASSTENVTPTGTRTPPSKRHYSTIPRQHGLQVLQQIQQELQQHKMEPNGSLPCTPSSTIQPPPPSQSQSHHNLTHSSLEVSSNNHGRKASSPGVSFGKVFFRLRNGKRSCSAPELAEPEIIPDPLENDSKTLPHDSQLMRLENKEKNKGLKKIFGRLRRSGSHSMDLKEGEFRRGGMRATAGPRLGWDNHRASPQPSPKKCDHPFGEWSAEEVCEWLEGIGLGMYLVEGKRWIKGGEQLLRSTPQEQEKELGVKNPLHKKNLQLALQAMDLASRKDVPLDVVVHGAGQLDHHWVVRWLDDVGLPQYKDSFVDARVDGRVLHFLTVEDLLSLKVINSLHHVSIKRGIQVLRQRAFDPHCLKRRSLPDESKDYRPEDVVLWTNHRVMEWLKTVDLSEYAPNLRGSGVHGALIVYEPRFTADLLAALLNIPSSKTLLRRHLSSQFKALVGLTLMQEKRDIELSPSPTQPPLTPNSKVKVSHKSQFPLLRRSKGRGEIADYACPLALATEQTVFTNSSKEPKPLQEDSFEDIGAVSKDISSLTSQLKDEKLLASMSATNV